MTSRVVDFSVALVAVDVSYQFSTPPDVFVSVFPHQQTEAL
jgi:hypothetical protein